MTYKKKLIEVALPLHEISTASGRDKDRKVGTIKNVHKWFAPMPTPAWRALLFASIVDDPEDPEKRLELLNLIRSLCPIDGSPPSDAVLTRARQVIQASGPPPKVFDPFCGGGSTLVEAQRLGLQAVGSDLNPVPVLITRLITQIIPNVSGHESIASNTTLKGVSTHPLDGFLEDVRHYARIIHDRAWERIGDLYAPVSGKAVAWLWARTVTCANPACRATIPMYSSPWLTKRPGEERWLRPKPDKKRITFEIGTEGVPPAATKVGNKGGNFRCVHCGEVTPEATVRTEGIAGRLGAQLMATVVDVDGSRLYLAPTPDHQQASDLPTPDDAPDILLPHNPRYMSPPLYGFKTQSSLYTARQLHVLNTVADLVAEIPSHVVKDGGSEEYAEAIATLLGICVGKLAQANSTQVRWNPRASGSSKAEPAFGRHVIAMVWDYAEVNPFGDSVGSWLGQVESTARGVKSLPQSSAPARVALADARSAASKMNVSDALIATDPPYFAQIGYADLSDYFYVWHRRALSKVHPDLYSMLSTPKKDELVANPYRHEGGPAGARDYFVQGFTDTFRSLAAASRSDLPIVVIYAHRQEESNADDGASSTAWDAMLEALLAANLAIRGTWPIRATTNARQVGIGTNALASSVALVCRPMQPSASPGTRKEFITSLAEELPDAINALRAGNIAPVDLAQAAIGPGMAIFTRYSKVIEADGTPMQVRTALALINQALNEGLSQQEDEFDSATRWAIPWFEQYAMNEGPFGEADNLARAKGVAVNGLVQDGLVESGGGRVRLLRPQELPAAWDPTTDDRVRVWEVTHHLVRALSEGGEESAAEMLRKVGASYGALARDLMYRLYLVCENRQWVAEAVAYNQLVVAWPEIQRLAGREKTPQQQSLG